MAIAQRGDFSPLNVEEMKYGNYIREDEIVGLIELINAVLSKKINILAYSVHEKLQVAVTDEWSYHFAVRAFNSQNATANVRIVVWSKLAMDWALYSIDPTSAALTSRVTGSSSTGSPGTGTFSWRTLVTGTDINTANSVARFQIKRTSGSGDFLGFVMFEEPNVGAPGATYYNKYPDTNTYRSLNSEALQGDRSFNVFALRALIEAAENALAHRTRGCAHVFPRDYAPIIGSIYFRGYGPFKFPVSEHCSKATVVMETFGGSAGELRGRWLSTNQKQSFDSTLFLDSDDLIVTQPFADPKDNEPYVSENIDVTPGELNDLFFFFISDYIDLEEGARVYWRWRWRSEGLGDLYGGSSSTIRDAYATDILISPYYTLPGYHIELIFKNAVDETLADDPKLTSDPLTLYGYGAGSDVAGGTRFDYSLMRYNTEDKVCMALSPCPDFLERFMGLSESAQSLAGDEEAIIYVELHTHETRYIASVWINEEMDLGDYGLGSSSIIPKGLSSATLFRNVATMLNTFAGTHNPVMGIGIPTMQGSLHRTYGYAVDSGGQVDYIERQGNWQIFYTFGEVYETPVDGSSNDDRLYQRVGAYPFLLPGAAANHETYLGPLKSLRVTIDYQACITKDRGRDKSFNVALIFKIFLSDSQATVPSLGGAADQYQTLIHVVDLTNKVFRIEDIKNNTNWAGFVAGDEAGRTRYSPNHIQATQLVAWPSEVLEDSWPWDREVIEFPLDTFITDEMPPEYWFVHVCVSYYTWREEGEGPRNGTASNHWNDLGDHINLGGCIVIPSVCVEGNPYVFPDPEDA